MRNKNIFIALFIGVLLAACNSKPKVIESVPIDSNDPKGNFEQQTDLVIAPDKKLDEHKVIVKEVLNTERYSYLNVAEGGEKFWIAIPRKEVEIGGTYYYKGGLLKRNFESKEYNRVFETLYLVSDVIPNPINSSEPAAKKTLTDQGINKIESANIKLSEGSIKLSELFSDPEKYQGKLIQITGKCVKVNPMIMGRNWIHIQDGSGDGLDLTITTTENIQLDAIVSLEGIIALDRDFGAGYRYDIIMEKAVLK